MADGDHEANGWLRNVDFLRSPRRLLRGAIVEPIRATPLEILVAVAAALVTSLEIENLFVDSLHSELVGIWWMTSVTIFVALIAASSLRFFQIIGRRARWIISGAYLAGGLLYGVFVLGADVGAGGPSAPEVYRWVLLTTALGLGLFLVPLAAREGPSRTRAMVGQFAVRLLRRFAVAGVFGFVLFIGLSGAIGSISTLFDVAIGGELYGHLATWLLGVVAPWTFVAGLPAIADPDQADPSELQTKLLTLAGNWLFLPLAGLYLAILYVYEGRVLVTGEAPKNLLSPLALGAAIMVIVGMFLLDYLRRTDRGRRLVDRLEWLPVAYAPVIPMPIWAIAVRIQQHGWTEFRYVRMLASIGVAAAFGYAAVTKLRGKSPKVQALPATFAVLFLAATFGPWSVVALPQSSQTTRLIAELREAGALEEGRIRDLSPERAGELEPQLVRNIQSRARYLESHYGRTALDGVAETELVAEANSSVGSLGLASLANVDPGGDDPTARGRRSHGGPSTTVNVDFASSWTLEDPTKIAEFREIGYTALDGESTLVTVERDAGGPLQADLSPIVEHLEERAPIERDWIDDLPTSLALRPLADDSGARRGTLIVKSVRLKRRPGNEFDVQSCRTAALLFANATSGTSAP